MKKTLGVICAFMMIMGFANGIQAQYVNPPPAPSYKVKYVYLPVTRTYERRIFYGEKHFMSVITDRNGAIAIRPHPGDDKNGWGSSLYPQPFLSGATLRGSAVYLYVTKTGITMKIYGLVSSGIRYSYGTWNTTMYFSFDPAAKQITGKGVYSIKLYNYLNTVSGDLNICKIASNYLTNVPLLDGTTGNTGDTKQVDVTNDLGTYTWVPWQQPGFFPQDRLLNLSINVEGQYNNVDTVAQGYAAIAPAYKPSLKVSYKLKLPTPSEETDELVPKVLLFDGFNYYVNSLLWYIPRWVSPTDGTYFGRTQIRCSQRSGLPLVKSGNARILLDTYNPTGYSFYGTDLITKKPIVLGEGILVTVVAKASTPFPRGIVSGIFLYNMKNKEDTTHDEIDFEMLSNNPYEINTNIYADEPLGAGNPISYPFASGSATDYHTYQILWTPYRVSWFVDSVLIRTITDQSQIPKGPMYLHLNIWAPAEDWQEAYDAGLQPVCKAIYNQAYALLVDSAQVDTLEDLPMIFGAIYDQSSSTKFWADNVGITPLITQPSPYKSFDFDVEFQSTALPDDHL